MIWENRARLGKGEREAVALARAHAVEFLLTNDEGASIVSRALGLKARGVLCVLLRAVKEKALGRREALETLNEMIGDGFWISPAVLQEFHRTLEKTRAK